MSAKNRLLDEVIPGPLVHLSSKPPRFAALAEHARIGIVFGVADDNRRDASLGRLGPSPA
jgi:hypothetical protein